MGRPAGACDLVPDRPAACRNTGTAGPFVQPCQRRAIIGEMLGLTAYRSVPVEPEPGQILDDRVGVFGAAARHVDVFKSQQKRAFRRARRPPPFKRRADMPEMQIPGRARRETGHDGLGHHPVY